MSYAIYVVSFNDEERRSRMNLRFKQNGLFAHYVKPVYTSDERIAKYDISKAEQRNWSIFFQHADSWRQFYEETSADYCIVCEDDVYIANNLKSQMPFIIQRFEEQKLDILLLSYLWPSQSFDSHYFPLLTEPTSGWNLFNLRKYPDDLWGAHMYMISREHAGKMLQKYTPEYAFSCVGTPSPFCTDWQFTKSGNRAILIPMVGVEEGFVKTDHQGQIDFHANCTLAHYSPHKFI